MYGNRSFNQASKAETPQFASAAALQGQAEANSKAQENSQLSNNLMGAGKLYNQGMGDKTPLYDLLADAFGPEETVNALRSGMEGVDLGVGGELTDSGIAAAEAQNEMYYAAQQAIQEEATRKAAELAVGG
tara:strand:+ start:402 stop:794 length:393 start_codon:yes stop_codon:yes gene_type:complete